MYKPGEFDDKVLADLAGDAEWRKHGFILRRTDDERVETNVFHLVVEHSPAGFEWGYGGSGPADLALNILECAIRANTMTHVYQRMSRAKCFNGTSCTKIAYAMHQDFKWQVIGHVPHAGRVIPWQEVIDWITAHSVEAAANL